MDTSVIVRAAEPEDAPGMVALNMRLSRETSFMLRTPDEVSNSLEETSQIIRRIHASKDEHLLVAITNAEIVGFVAAHRRAFHRVRHCFSVVLGITKDHWGLGLGRHLMRDIEIWAKNNGGSRLELSVLSDNDRAIRLYTRCGFNTEGTRRAAIRVGDEFVDEFYMSKLV